MDKNELANLLDRYRRGECTEEECLLIESLYLHTYQNNAARNDDTTKTRVWQYVSRRLQKGGGKVIIPWLAAAASLLLIVAVASLYHPRADPTPVDQLADIPAGGNRATLMLAGGQTVRLDSSQQGVMVLADRLLYTDSTAVERLSANRGTGEDVFNEIATPRGGTYQVVLTDGTKVWLNADSRLRFPQRFADARREVTLIGEAYFEVTKNPRRPFVVKTAGQEIAVLGTSFNVAAYGDEADEQTTLVEGEVVVSAAQGSHHLSPGDQAVVKGEDVSIAKVDTAPFIAWKSGSIAFNERTLENIMRDIGRWYDVDVHFKGVDKQLRFGGMVSRYANVSEVLRRLELTGQVHFKIEERGIVVKP